MTAPRPLHPPVSDALETLTYVANPRPKRSFNTILDAHQLFDRNGRSQVTTRVYDEQGERRVEIKASHALHGGAISESLSLTGTLEMRALSLARRLVDTQGVVSREERIDFTRGPLRLPDATYPEVLLPFLLRWLPEGGERRAIHAWIVDRFVARVYCEWSGRHTITVPAGRFDTIELVMYPDLNDWVALGSMLNTLAKPFLPKYRMWFEATPARRVVRFEGPYGPPGAPEIILELA